MFDNDWDYILKDYLGSEEFACLWAKVLSEYSQNNCYPHIEDVFNAFKFSNFANTKVVILGQDPYYSVDCADGLAFSVKTKKLPPSLENIFQCVKKDIPNAQFTSGSLKNWAQQGVLLLNTSLSVREGSPLSHADFGWDKLIRLTLDKLNQKGGVVFMLWGSHAMRLMPKEVWQKNNLYLTAPHPSPLSAYRGFFDCQHFKKCNEFLDKKIDFSAI